MRQAPPGRTSITHSSMMTPGGHIHCTNKSCFAQASNMRSGVASKIRVIFSVWSSRTADIAFSFRRRRRGSGSGCGALQEGVEPVELRLPEFAVELHPVGRGAQPLAAQLATAPLRLGVAQIGRAT